MSKLVNGYNAVLISADVTVGQNIDGCKNDIGKNGQLTIWESENTPGPEIHKVPNGRSFRRNTDCLRRYQHLK